MPTKISEADFVRIWHECGSSPVAVAERTGIALTNIYKRRSRLAERGVLLSTIPAGNGGTPIWAQKFAPAYPREIRRELPNGVIVIGSDAHVWPGPRTVAQAGFIEVIKRLRPQAVVLNGDIFDGARVSRHARIGWAKTPTVKEELSAVQDFVAAVEQAAKPARGCSLYWTVGNHDSRFDNVLAQNADAFEGMNGFRLSDHFPRWEMAWSLYLNGDGPSPFMIKHRFASSGVHAGYNATLKAGVSTINGHTHILEVKPWGDYRGRRYGIQGGCLADLDSAAFEYTENNPSPACPGFVVATIRDGVLLYPELAEVVNGKCWFRGEVVAEAEELAAAA